MDFGVVMSDTPTWLWVTVGGPRRFGDDKSWVVDGCAGDSEERLHLVKRKKYHPVNGTHPQIPVQETRVRRYFLLKINTQPAEPPRVTALITYRVAFTLAFVETSPSSTRLPFLESSFETLACCRFHFLLVCTHAPASAQSTKGVRYGFRANTRREAMGRRRVEMKRIEDKSSRQVTFSKRRGGLMKKARELSVLCGVDVGVVVFSCRGKLYDFCSGTDRLPLSLVKSPLSLVKSSTNVSKNTWLTSVEIDTVAQYPTPDEIFKRRPFYLLSDIQHRTCITWAINSPAKDKGDHTMIMDFEVNPL
ncbi:hypothetical protein RJ639_024837, partial [Escallonia herrerae]